LAAACHGPEAVRNVLGPRTVDYFLQVDGLWKVFQRSDMETLQRQFSRRVSAFLDRTGLSPTRFDRMALGDPNLMRQIDGGRSLTLRDGGPGSGVHLRVRPGVGRHTRSTPPSPVPEACIESEENATSGRTRDSFGRRTLVGGLTRG